MPNLLRSLPVLALLLICLPTQAGDHVLTFDPEATDVTWYLKATGHDVEGRLFMQSGEIRFDPGAGTASGEVIIDALRTESGNKKRDKTMHKKVLESDLFPQFVFKPQRIDGEVALDGKSQFDLVGILSIHGTDHPVTVPTEAEISGDRITAQATFPVPFVEWGMEDPSILFLRVAKVVDVTIAAKGKLSGSTDAEASNR